MSTDARRRWLGSRGNAHHPSFSEAFDGGFNAGIESAWAAAEQLIEDCAAIGSHLPEGVTSSLGGVLEAFAEARHDLLAAVAQLDRRFDSQEGGGA